MKPTSAEATPIPERSPATALPEKIGRYAILARIGAGGMGTVYKAHDPHLNRTVALKLPRIDTTPEDRAKRVERFQREARSAAQIWHPHVCPIYDVGEHDGQPYVVMAYVEGQSLAGRLAREGRFEDVGEAVALVRQVLDALEAVHDHGIVHRDLKPSNVMLDAAGRAVLTDFGLARPENEAGRLTSEGVIVGTPAYMAPEQAAGQSDRIGPWTDLYSVGVLFFEMLTGRLPFEGPPLAVLNKILHEPPPALSGLRPYLDPRLESVLSLAMAKEPEGRFQSARQFADALRTLSIPSSAVTTFQPSVPQKELQKPSGPPVVAGGVPSWFPNPKALVTYLLPGALFAVAAVALLAGAITQARYMQDQFFALALWLLVAGGGIVAIGLVSRWLLRQVLDTKNSEGETGLMIAARDGKIAVARGLSACGAEVNEKDKSNQTALMKAAANGHLAVVRLLLAHGAEVNDRDNEGLTALSKAEAKGHLDIVELLKQSGARDSGPATKLPPPR